MKISWVWLILAIVAGWAVGSFSMAQLSKQQFSKRQAMSEARLKNRLAALEAQQEELKSGKTQWVREPSQGSIRASGSSSEIIDALIRINDVHFQDEKHRQWRIIYHLEQLVDLGEKAIPDIHTFLQRNEDVQFHKGQAAVGRRQAISQFDVKPLFPSSLRLGLIEVLERIGGEIAEASLLEVLQITGRGVEIALAAQTLEQMAPRKYVDVVTTAARELLNEPLKGDDGVGVDAETRAYLFRLLNDFGDESFLEQAKTQLIFEDGRLDHEALSYVMDSEGEDAMESVFNAFQNSDVLVLSDRLALAKRGLEFVGDNEYSNEMFYALMRDPQLPVTLKEAFAQGMAAGNAVVLANPPSSTEAIKTRMQILETIRAEMMDVKVRESIGRASDQLQSMLDALPATP
jgi:hypothetical protein